MAESVKLPGTEMEVYEKYPLSRRLDHPDFADVCKTTYAKGVITDFKKTNDDPITVESMVKVSGDFGGSDYIPIFYHPKAKYWDDPSIKATDFDEKTGAFKKAWMSFRCDDEVAVMLKEDKPVAVIGFTDGIPREGEDILKAKGSDIYRARVSIAEKYNSDTGPDGLDLRLNIEAELIKEQSGEESLGSWIVTDFRPSAWVVTHTTTTTSSPPALCIGWNTTMVWTLEGDFEQTIKRVNSTPKYFMHLAKIGPILYFILTKYSEDFKIEEKQESGKLLFGIDPPAVCVFGYVSCFPWAGPGLNYDYCADGLTEKRVTDKLDEFNAADKPEYPDIDLSDYDDKECIISIYAAIYSKELYNKIKGSPPTIDKQGKMVPDPPTDFIYQTVLNGHDDFCIQVKTKGGVKYYTRPHTKEELGL